jgi:peptidoglycan hydrolase-like protein with peptidoglycan-binding domain
MKRFLLVTASTLALVTGGAAFGPALAQTYQHSSSAMNSANAQDNLRFAQQELQERGYYKGPIDGIMGPQTKAALQRFQQDNKLRVTAGLDQQTLDVLKGGEMNKSGQASSGTSSTGGATSSGSSGTSPGTSGAGSAPSQSPRTSPGGSTGGGSR